MALHAQRERERERTQMTNLQSRLFCASTHTSIPPPIGYPKERERERMQGEDRGQTSNNAVNGRKGEYKERERGSGANNCDRSLSSLSISSYYKPFASSRNNHIPLFFLKTFFPHHTHYPTMEIHEAIPSSHCALSSHRVVEHRT